MKYVISVVFSDGDMQGAAYGSLSDALKDVEKTIDNATFEHPEKVINISITKTSEEDRR